MSIITSMDFAGLASNCNWIIPASIVMLASLVLLVGIFGVLDILTSQRSWDFAEKVVVFAPAPQYVDEWENLVFTQQLHKLLDEFEKPRQVLSYSPPEEVVSVVRVPAKRRHVIRISSPGYYIPGLPIFTHGEPPVRCC